MLRLAHTGRWSVFRRRGCCSPASVLFSGEGKQHFHTGSFTKLATDIQPTAVTFHYMFDDREAQACSTRRTAAAGIGAVKPPGQMGQMVGSYAIAPVGNG